MPGYTAPYVNTDDLNEDTDFGRRLLRMANVASAVSTRRGSSSGAVPESASGIITDTRLLNLAMDELLSPPPVEDIDPSSEVRIGWTKLRIPPTAIQVDEFRYNEEIPGLRTRGNALVKTGRGHIRIRLPMEFITSDEINDGIGSDLREIVAQFRSCPFTTIENDLLSTAVMLKRSDREAAEAYRVASDARDLAVMQYSQLKDRFINKITYRLIPDSVYAASFGHTVNGVRAGAKTRAEVAEYLTEDFSRAEEVLNAILPQCLGSALSVTLTPILREAKTVLDQSKEAWDAVVDKSRELAEAAQAADFAYPAVPVALQQLTCQTVPGSVNRLQANLDVVYFNTEPYMPTLSFMGPMANPSQSITSCVVYWDHIQRFLESEMRQSYTHRAQTDTLGEWPTDGGSGLLNITYPIPELERVPRDKRQASPDPNRVNVAGDDEDYEHRLKTRSAVLGNDGIVVEQVVVSLENTLAPQPVEGHMYGTLQYTGASNARVRFVLNVTGDTHEEHMLNLQKIHSIKKQTETVALRYGEEIRRNTRITIDNDVTRLFGVRHVLLDRVTTQTKAVNTTQVTLDFVEYTSSQDKREKIVLHGSDTNYVDKISLKYLADLVAAANHGVGSAEILELADQCANEFGDADLWAKQSLYIDQNVISARLLARTLRMNPEYSSKISDYLNRFPSTTVELRASEAAELREALRQSDALMDRIGEPSYWSTTSTHRATHVISCGMPTIERAVRESNSDLFMIKSGFAAELREKYSEGSGQAYAVPFTRLWRAARQRIRDQIKNIRTEGRAAAKTEAEEHVLAHKEASLVLAQDMIRWWRTREDDADSTSPTAKMDSLGIGIVIPAGPTEDMISKILMEIKEPEFDIERDALSRIKDEARKRFTAVQDKVREAERITLDRTLYPDLGLPDYATAFSRVWAAIKNRLGVDVTNYKDLTGLPKRVEDVVRLIIPTYEDLGIKPPIGRTVENFARRLTDTVDPDFYFFWRKIKSSSFMRGAQRKAANLAASTPTPLKHVDLGDPVKDNDLGTAKARNRSVLSPGDTKPTNKYGGNPEPAETFYTSGPGYSTNEASAEHRAAAMPGVKAGRNYVYMPACGELADKLDDLNPDDDVHRKRLFEAAVADTPDRMHRMITAFPCFKFYLIETDSEQLSLFDDWYGYSAVKSIKIHHHKYIPDIAEIEVIDATKNLDYERGLSSDSERKAYEDADRSGPGEREDVTEEKKHLDNFFLAAGTPVVVKLGYSSKEEELETRFTGQIVSVSGQDVIKIVAQSYASELTVPVNAQLPGRDPLFVVHSIMESCPAIHYGDWPDYEDARHPDTGEILGQTKPPYQTGILAGRSREVSDYARTASGWLGEWITNPVRDVRDFFTRYLSNRRTTNVFLPVEYSWMRLMGAGSGTQWGIPNVTGLEALHELTRHLPGYVCATRPYDNGATLFFGRPEQPYFYTRGKKDEEDKWAKEKARIDQDREIKIWKLLRQFLSSRYAPAYQMHCARISAIAAGEHPDIDDWTSQWVRAAGADLPFALIEQIQGSTLSLFGLIDNLEDYNAWMREQAGVRPVLPALASTNRLGEMRAIEDKLSKEGLHTLAGLYFYVLRAESDISKAGNWLNEIGIQIFGYDTIQAGMGFSDALNKARQLRFTGARESAEQAEAWLGDKAPAGITFYYYENWRNALAYLSKSYGNNANSFRRLHSSAFPEYYPRGESSGEDDRRAVRAFTGETIDRLCFDSMVSEVTRSIPYWKVFLLYFHHFLQEEASPELMEAIYESSKSHEDLGLNPRMKRFRNHHFAHSSSDIVKNAISTSREFMANRVVISWTKDVSFKKYGDNLVIYTGSSEEKTKELAFDDDIDSSDWVVRVVTEPNANNSHQAYNCAKSNLAEGLRTMYRGTLILRGHERCWPYDVVWIHDEYNGIYGPVEAESVTDHMDRSGYFVSVVPHAVVWAESGSQFVDTSSLSTFGSWLAYLLRTAAVNPSGGVEAGVNRTYTEDPNTGRTLAEQHAIDVKGFVLGRGLWGHDDHSLRITPLTRHGLPWTAGLKGIGTGGWMVRLERRWETAKAGFNKFWPKANELIFGE